MCLAENLSFEINHLQDICKADRDLNIWGIMASCNGRAGESPGVEAVHSRVGNNRSPRALEARSEIGGGYTIGGDQYDRR